MKTMVSEEKMKLLAAAIAKNKLEKKKTKNMYGDNKHTHDWFSSFGYSNNRSSGAWHVSHCKKCGIPYIIFKCNPLSCEEYQVKNKSQG